MAKSLKKDIGSLRENYTKAKLNKSMLNKDPMKQFAKWFEEARASKIKEANAMHLATVSKKGISTRAVLLKSYDELGFVFYTNFNSKKGKAMAENPKVAVNFLWKDLERQVRIEGRVKKVSKAQSKAYFQSRPRGSQVGAWVSEQSAIIKDRRILERRKKEIEAKFEGHDVLPVPPNWGGYCIQPKLIEFWQGRESRLHDRMQYRLSKGKWIIERLAP